jgi:hypothetical protein
MRLEIERPELVCADDHVGVVVLDVVGAVHHPVQMQNAVLLGLEVGIGALLPGRKRQAVSWGRLRATCLLSISRRWARVKVGGRLPA